MTALTWGEYKTVIRRSILNDAAGDIWDDALLADFAGWALDAFCTHTAVASGITYSGDDATVEFSLPANLYEPLDVSGQIILHSTSSTSVIYLKPAYSNFEINPSDATVFKLWPTNKVTLNHVMTTAESLELRYYAYYPHPADDSDVMSLPSWAYTAVAYDIATHALTYRSLIEATDSAHKGKPEQGQPENNSLRQMQQWWIKLYEREMARQPRQWRITTPK